MALSSDLKLLYKFEPNAVLEPTDNRGPTLTFSNASADRSYYDETGTLVYAAANEPRPDYNPTTLAYRGLRIEPTASTNQIINSEEFNTWTNVFQSVVTNTDVAPDGTTTADTLNDTFVGEGRSFKTGFTIADNDVWAASVYIKKDSTPASTRVVAFNIRFFNGTISQVVFKVDTSNGDSIAGVQFGGATFISSKVEAIGTDWWRLHLVCQNDATGNTDAEFRVQAAYDDSLADLNQDINVTGSCVAWGAQFEKQPVVTSYIPTSGSTVTRAADVCNTTDVSWYTNASPSTWYVEFETPAMAVGVGPSQHAIGLDSGSTSDGIYIISESGTNRISPRITNSGTQFYGFGVASPLFTSGNVERCALAAATDDGIFYFSGEEGNTDTDINYPDPVAMTRFQVGETAYGTSTVIWMREIRYYNTRRPNTGGGSLEAMSNGLVDESKPAITLASDIQGRWPCLPGDPLAATPGYGPAMTFTNASADRAYYDSTGTLVYAGVNEPRPDYDPATLRYRGLMVEGESTNLALNSEALSGWSGFNSPTQTADDVSAPDGTLTGDTIGDTDSGSFAWIQSAGATVGTSDTMTVSLFIKKDSVGQATRWPMIRLTLTGGVNTECNLMLDTATGEIGSFVGPGSATIDNTSVMELTATGWWRVSMTCTNDGSGNTNALLLLFPAAGVGALGAPQVVATATGSVGAWGAQLEIQNRATSYIATSGSTITRAADTDTAEGIEHLINQGGPYTVYYDRIDNPSQAAAFQELGLSRTGGNEDSHYYNIRTTGESDTTIRDDNTTVSFLTVSSDFKTGETKRVATGVGTTNRTYANGVASNESTPASNPDEITRMGIGHNTGQPTAARSCYWFRDIRLYDTRRANTGAGSLEELSFGLSAAELASTTADYYRVWNLDSGEVYYSKNLDQQNQHASLTKIMTMKLLLDYYPTNAALEAESVTIVAGDLVGGSSADLEVDDVWTLHDLLVGMLLPSGNDAATAVARYVGTNDLGDPVTPVDTFLAEMNAEALRLGMTNTDYDTVHGNDVTTLTTVNDYALLVEAVKDHPVFRELGPWGNRFVYIDRPAQGGPGWRLVMDNTNDLCSHYGFRAGKTGTVSESHLLVIFEAPNGQEIGYVGLDSDSDAARYTDFTSTYNQLLSDFPALATPVTPWTPSTMFTELSADGVGFDASDSGVLWQDTSQTTPADQDSDPVDRWDPSYSTPATASLYWRSDAGTARPLFNTGGYLLGDGSNDYMSLGQETVGSTGLFADAGERFMVAAYYRMTADGTILARAASNGNDRTFQMYSSGSFSGAMYCRGAFRDFDNNIDDDIDHAMGGAWDGVRVFGDPAKSLVENVGKGFHEGIIGTAAENTGQNITIFARTNGTGFHLNGRIYRVVIVDAYDSDQFRRMMDWIRGGTPNSVRNATGEPPPATGYEVQAII